MTHWKSDSKDTYNNNKNPQENVALSLKHINRLYDILIKNHYESDFIGRYRIYHP